MSEVDDKDKYEQGIRDAWECIWKIVAMPSDGGFNNDELTEMFEVDTPLAIMERYSPLEIQAKVKAYEENQVHIGDEVERVKGCLLGRRYVVLSTIHLPAYVDAMTGDGEMVHLSLKTCKKTGRHFSQIEEVLEQLSENTVK